MGVEHGGEEAEGESTNAEREVEAAGVAERLESLGRQGSSGSPTGLGTRGTRLDKEGRLTPLLSGAGRWP